MGYSLEVKNKALNIIRDRKLSAERDAEIRRDKIFAELPNAGEYERKIAFCGIKAGRAVLGGGDVKHELEKLKNESLKLQAEYETLLNSKGYSVKDTEPKYFCEKCGDTGYVEIDNKTVICSCLKKVMIESACDELNRRSPLSLCTFDDFNLDYYSKEFDPDYPRSSYEQMKKIFDFCKRYAETFSNRSESIFMNGMTGLGKTHLSLAIANEAIKKGYGVIYVSAPILISQLEKEQFSKNKENNTTEETLAECDLLIVDDLGTEFTTQFSSKAIYNIFNSRLLMGKPIIVNTNLTLDKLEKIYTERFVSRIIGEAERLDFFGRDVRLMKK